MVINCINVKDIDDVSYQLFRNAVSKERKNKADRFRFFNDSKRSICAELLIQYSLWQSIDQFIELNFTYNKFGKPYINHLSSFLFNLSHSGQWVVIAFGHAEVGVDIEKIQTGKDCITDNFFTEEEKSYIYEAVNEEKEKRFTKVWTLKESYVKYLGTGLFTKLNSFSVNAKTGLIKGRDGSIRDDIKIRTYQFETDYYLSICSTKAEVEEISIHKIELKELVQYINKRKINYL